MARQANGIPVEVFEETSFFERCVFVRREYSPIYYPQHLYFALVLLSWSTLIAVFAIPRLNGIKAGGSRQLRDGVFCE